MRQMVGDHDNWGLGQWQTYAQNGTLTSLLWSETVCLSL
jgi:hypothetical protein